MTGRDSDAALRSARTQAAIVRTLAGEIGRESPASDRAEALRAQTVEESARLASALEDLTAARSGPHPHGKTGGSASRAAPTETAAPWPRILVVEDDDETRIAVARGLSPEYEVTTARDGAEGLALATQIQFDAIVSDIGMPELDGVAMVDRIRAAYAPAFVPVVFLTAETAPERIAAGFSAGATSYMVKPLDLELLDIELKWLLGRHQTPLG